MMKNKKYVIPFLVFLIATVLYADAVIKKFELDPEYNKVIVRWETGNDATIKHFEVQRGTSMDRLDNVKTMSPLKSSEVTVKYEWADNSVFKTTAGERTFYYRIKTVKNSASGETYEYSKIEKITPTVSSARHTWGSIKAIFR